MCPGRTDKEELWGSGLVPPSGKFWWSIWRVREKQISGGKLEFNPAHMFLLLLFTLLGRSSSLMVNLVPQSQLAQRFLDSTARHSARIWTAPEIQLFHGVLWVWALGQTADLWLLLLFFLVPSHGCLLLNASLLLSEYISWNQVLGLLPIWCPQSTVFPCLTIRGREDIFLLTLFLSHPFSSETL